MIDFNARAMMEKAVEVMRLSIAERRNDGKAAPKVGAVLIDIGDHVPNRSRITTAYRGELREGDHAEFTLLERKNRDQKLDECVLFATLEPCAPNARRFPKLGCAERIVNARIKQVWIGIEDPDPTVDRKGIKFLQENGVTVHMFHRDLQEIIRAENKEFLEMALERAAAAEEPVPEVVLSPLEKPAGDVRLDDLSDEALDVYRSFAGIADAATSAEFRRRLVRQGLLQQVGHRFVPTGFGLLLFGKEPRTVMPQAGLLATIHFADGGKEIRDFDGPQILVPEQVLRWLQDKLPNLIDRTTAHRRDVNKPIFELVREGIVNALVHRDLSIAGAKCQLIVTPETIEIRSPGGPVDPITLAQLQSFAAPMLSRNPVLHYVFAQVDLAEERGLGLRSIKGRAEELGLPLPQFSWEAPYLVLRIHRSLGSVTSTLSPDVVAQLNEDERSALAFVAQKGSVTTPETMASLSIDEKKAQRILRKLIQLNLVQRVGKGPATRYERTEP